MITHLGRITINGITFRKADNGPHVFYDYHHNGLYWVILQPKLTPNSPFKTPWWAAHVWRGNSVCNLNFACRHTDGVITKDPFYDLTDSGHDDPPINLLTAIAQLITNGVDPWALPKIIDKEAQP